MSPPNSKKNAQHYLNSNSLGDSFSWIYIQIKVTTIDGSGISLKVNRFSTVGDLKQRVCMALREPVAFSRLHFNGIQLSNDQVLQDIGVEQSSILNINWRPVILTQTRLNEEIEKEKTTIKFRRLTKNPSKGQLVRSKSSRCNVQ